MGTSDPGLNPVDVVEDVADMLLDELLGEQAQGKSAQGRLRSLCCSRGARSIPSGLCQAKAGCAASVALD